MTVNVKPGDRVRVVLEGVATYVNPHDGAFDLSIDSTATRTNYVVPTLPHVVSVEVLAKQFKVGDTVSGDDYAKLPVGTVVEAVAHDSGPRVKIARDHWIVFSEGPGRVHDRALNDPRTIKYLPDAS